MNNKVYIDQAVLRILYYKYKEYIVPGLIVAVSFFLFSQFIFPQFQTILSEKDQIAANEQTLAVMTQNYNFMVSQKDTELDNLLNVANAALPKNKDFAGVLTAISNAAGLSGVTLNDYSFQIGDLTGTTINLQDGQMVKVNLVINGSIDQTKKFLVALQQQLPISEVTSLDIPSPTTASINADFFYSPLTKIMSDNTSPIGTLTVVQKKMLQDLAGTTNIPSDATQPIVTPASKSATTTPIRLISPTASASSASAAQL